MWSNKIRVIRLISPKFSYCKNINWCCAGVRSETPVSNETVIIKTGIIVELWGVRVLLLQLKTEIARAHLLPFLPSNSFYYLSNLLPMHPI